MLVQLRQDRYCLFPFLIMQRRLRRGFKEKGGKRKYGRKDRPLKLIR